MISVVGNASSLLMTDYGPVIDRGKVIRFNQGVPRDEKAQGSKTDLVVTYSLDKWESIKKHWHCHQNFMVLSPYPYKDTHGLHPSTLMAFLLWMDGANGVHIFGVDHNASWSFYQDHKGYNHDWEKEADMMRALVKKNNWVHWV